MKTVVTLGQKAEQSENLEEAGMGRQEPREGAGRLKAQEIREKQVPHTQVHLREEKACLPPSPVESCLYGREGSGGLALSEIKYLNFFASGSPEPDLFLSDISLGLEALVKIHYTIHELKAYQVRVPIA